MDERGLGKRLQEARLKAGLTQQQLCSKAGLSFSTLTKIERGAIKSPSIFTIQAIAGAVDLGLDELIGVSVPKASQKLNKTRGGASFIYFDVNGCLVYFYQRAFDKLAMATGAHLETIESAFWHYNDEVCRGALSTADFNAKLAKRLNVDKLDWQEYYIDTVEPIKEMQELLKWASQNYRIGLMTNIMPGFLSAMISNGTLPDLHYDAIIDSSEIGAIKPEAKMYQVAQEKAGCPASEILLIDDDRVNLMAADRLDWHVMWFDDSRPEESVERAREALKPVS